MALGMEGSKGILYMKGGEQMAMGFEGSKGILHHDTDGIRKEFQELIFSAAKKELGWEEFVLKNQTLSPRICVSAFVNSRCSQGCGYCYLRNRQKPETCSEVELSEISNSLNAVDFSAVGMEPLETWERTRNILEMINAPRKALITNTMHLNDEIAVWLAKNNILVDFSIGEKHPEKLIGKARLLAKHGIMATASCIVIKNGINPLKIIDDITAFGFPLVFFSCCNPSGKTESDDLVLKLIEDLRTRQLQTKILIKVDFLSPALLGIAWKKYFSDLEFSDLCVNSDEGFLIREFAPNLLLGIYPFPGEFINRIRIDADGALTTCHHMQLPLENRLAVRGDLRFHPEKWLGIPEVLNYHRYYWDKYFG